MRRCQQCGIAMPFGRARRRDNADGLLKCNGCHPDGKGPGEGRPVGHHGAKDDDDFGYPRKIGTDFSCPRCGTVNKLPGEDESDTGLNANWRNCSNPTCGKSYMPETVFEPKCSATKPGSKMQCHLREGHSGDHEAYAQNSSGLRTWAVIASERDPIKMLAMQYIAHDSGDGETIYHCPFCGGGQVTGRSDGTVECGFCNTAFTVQVQPVHSGAPQTINGQPVKWPGEPEGSFDPVQKADPFDPASAPAGAKPPPGAPPADDGAPPPADGAPPAPKKNPVPPQFQRGSSLTSRMFLTQAGHVLDEEAYQRHLALLVADDPTAVIAEIQAERQG